LSYIYSITKWAKNKRFGEKVL
jgi:hypothetical protein